MFILLRFIYLHHSVDFNDNKYLQSGEFFSRVKSPLQLLYIHQTFLKGFTEGFVLNI